MSTVTDNGFPTLQNVASRMAPDGSIATVAEILTKKLRLLEDVPWKESNLPTGHLVSTRAALPAVTWRKINQGVPNTKSDTNNYQESAGNIEAFSAVDSDLVRLNGNGQAFRLSEDKAFLQAFDQEFERAVFYENATTNPERIHGLAARYPGSSGYTTSSYVQPQGTLSGVNCESIWLINWDPDKVFLFYPKGSTAGLENKDLGEMIQYDSNSNKFMAYVSHYKWKFGMAVTDYRYVVRAQWDPDDTTTFPDSGKAMYLLLQSMIDSVYDLTPYARFYVSRTTAKKFDTQLLSNTVNGIEYIEMNGRRIRSFMGVPIRVTDALIGESAIS